MTTHGARDTGPERPSLPAGSGGAHGTLPGQPPADAELLAEAVRQMPTAVVVIDPGSGRVIHANDRMLQLLEVPLSDGSSLGAYLGRRPDGSPVGAVDWPLLRALGTGEPVAAEEIDYVLADGSRATMSVSAAPVRGRAGEVAAVVCTISDVSERRRSERRFAAQHAVSAILAEAATLAEAGEALLAALGEAFGWSVGAVWRVDEIAGLLRCESTWQAPGAAADAFLEATASATFRRGEGQPGRVWRAGDAQWLDDAATDTAFSRAPQAAMSGLHCGIAAPVLLGGRVLGVVEFFGRSVQPPDQEQLAVLAAVGNQIGQVMERHRAEREAHAERQRLRIALEAGQMGVWDWDIGSGAVRWSDSLEAMFGLEPGSFGGTFDAYAAALHPDDRDATLAVVGEAARTAGAFRVEHRVLRPDGEVRWIEGRGQALLGPSGTPVAMTGVALDITERKAEEHRLRDEHRIADALHTAGRAIGGRLDVQGVVQTVTDAATSLTGAQFGAFFYNVTGDSGETYALYTLSGAERESFAGFPTPRNTDIFEPTFRGTGVVRLDDVTADPRYGRNAPYRGMPEGHLPVRSYLAVPVTGSDGAVIAGLFLGHAEAGVFGEDSERLAVGIAAQAAVAVENARLYDSAQREIEARRKAFEERDHVARVLQASLLPPVLPDIPGIEVGASYRAGSADVGGDFYDVFPLGGGEWGVVIGDVCGKGTEAAALTALARHTLRTAATIEPAPREALRVLNDAVLREDWQGRFCSAALVRVTPLAEGVRLTVALGGHPPPVLHRADGTLERLGPGGILLGLVPDVEAVDQVVELGPGELAVLYTDGVVEARNADAAFGDERLDEILASVADAPAWEVASSIGAAVAQYQDGRFAADDVAVVVLRVPPTSASPRGRRGGAGSP